MASPISDGKGRGYLAEVNVEQELVCRAVTEPEIEHSSSLGRAYAWDSTELDIDIGDTMLFVQNTSDTPLVLDSLIINGSNVICTWDVGIGTATTTATGTTVTGVNLNTGFEGLAAEANAFSDETAVADASVIVRIKTGVSGHHVHSLTGAILRKNHYIQINQETESTSGSAILVGHYENPS